MSEFELWIKGCEINGTKIYPLDGSEDSALYKCWKEHIVNHNVYYELPVFIGWVHGKQVAALTDYLMVYNIWKNRMENYEKEMPHE